MPHTHHGRDPSPQIYSILVVALFLATELYPLLAAMDDELLLAMSGAGDTVRAAGGAGLVESSRSG